MSSKTVVATVVLAVFAGMGPMLVFAQEEDLSATGPEVPGANARSVAMSTEDSEFLAKAVKVSAREVADADMALRNSQRPEVKSAARDIASTHSRTREQIDALARRKGVELSDETLGISSEQARSDATVVAALLKTHEDAVASFHRESIRGTDPDVRRFAQGALPSLQRDLASLRTLQSSLPVKDST